jgi:hypothetical protein
MQPRLALPLLFLAACHGAASPTPTPPEPRAGEISALQFPASIPDAPQVLSAGGSVIANPKVVAITFAGEDRADDIEAFVAGIGATSYWHDATAEYGVGPLTALAPVRLTETPPANTTDQEIQAWVAGKLDGTHPEFATPSLDTIYAVFYPATTTITQGGSKSCSAFGGYHNEAPLKAGLNVAYAVLPRCTDPRLGMFDYLTSAASHELIEASTDPRPLTDPAYGTLDDAHFVWERFLGGAETGDMCAQNVNADYKPADFPYTVQRNWSNASAAAGQDPCVPADPSMPYFNAAPATPMDDMALTFAQQEIDTKGWTLSVGESKTIALELFSTAPTETPWQIDAFDMSSLRSGMKSSSLAFSFDSSTGQNGSTVQMTVTATGVSTSRLGASTFIIRSKLGERTNFWLGLIKISS